MSETRFGHGDLIDSTQMQTDESGAAIDLNGAGGGTGPVSYTAFGEAVGVGGWGEGGAGPAGPVGDGSLHDELDTRYRFAGGYGYESAGGAAGSPAGGYGAALLALPGAWGWGASGSGYCGANPILPPITLQHLGWRWYQADSGRFVQRDPIGIRGGMNAYAYVHHAPLALADPSGLDDRIEYTGQQIEVILGAETVIENGIKKTYLVTQMAKEYRLMRARTTAKWICRGLTAGAVVGGKILGKVKHPAAQVGSWVCVGGGILCEWVNEAIGEYEAGRGWELYGATRRRLSDIGNI